MLFIRSAVAAAAAAMLQGPAFAQGTSVPTPATEQTVAQAAPQRLEITGTREAQDKTNLSVRSEALPAAVRVIEGEQLERQNIRMYSDLYATVPGVQSGNFGQGDIGSPIVVRGFGSGGIHGGATAVYIDGVPQNIPSDGIGGNGASEYNWLTPEMIERVEIIKGPFSAVYGDQSLGGVINIVTKACAPSSIGLEAGRYGVARVAGVGCGNAGPAKLFGVVEAYHSDGYRANSKYDRLSLFGKATTVLGASEVSLRGNLYRSEYDVPGYLNIDLLKAGLDPRSTPYEFSGGENTRYSLVATARPASGEAGWYATAYYDYFDRVRFGAFNAATPRNQNEGITKRDVFGGRVQYNLLVGERGAVLFGLETRQDRGDAASFAVVERTRTGVVNNDYGLDLRSYSAYVQAQVKVLDNLKLVAGYRFDRFEQDIENRLRPERSGTGNQSIGSPRFGLAFTVNRNLSLFANAGEGFRSLGATELSPAAAVGFKNFGFDIPKGKTRDIGFNARLGPVQVNGTYYHTVIDSELRQEPVGSGILVNVGDSKREGHELDARWAVNDALAVYGSYAHVNAVVRNPVNPAQPKLQNVVPNLYKAGFEFTQPVAGGRLLVDANFQHYDHEVFYLNNVERQTDIYQIYSAKATLELGKQSFGAYLIVQPREFGSDFSGASHNPKPRTDGGVTYKYTF